MLCFQGLAGTCVIFHVILTSYLPLKARALTSLTPQPRPPHNEKISPRRRRPHQPRALAGFLADFITQLFALFVVLFASVYRDNKNIVRLSNAIHNAFRDTVLFPVTPIHATPRSSRLKVQLPSRPISTPRSQRSVLPPPRRPIFRNCTARSRAPWATNSRTGRSTCASPRRLRHQSPRARLLRQRSGPAPARAADEIRRISKFLSHCELELRIEGHSDNQPINNAQFRNDWESSTARAMTVLLLLVNDAGYDPTKVSVAGCAQYHPHRRRLAPRRPPYEPPRRPRGRRYSSAATAKELAARPGCFPSPTRGSPCFHKKNEPRPPTRDDRYNQVNYAFPAAALSRVFPFRLRQHFDGRTGYAALEME